MTVFTHPEFDNHESIVHVHDRDAGLRAIIALHDTSLGPALGGTRMWPFADDAAALRDVLRLSRAMTYKAALAGVPHGGGKSVIIGDPRRDKTPRLVAAFARAVDSLGGRYIMAEDVGTSEADMDIARRHTRHVVGTSRGLGDPSPATARGVLAGMRAALAHAGVNRLAGVRVAVQGLGHVGARLCRLLHDEGARLVVADVNPDAVATVRDAFGAEVASPERIHEIAADVFAPCALGGVLNAETVPRLRAGIVAGAANNQLASPRDGEALAARGILYVPDYVLNAGGLIWVSAEHAGKGREEALRAVDGIAGTVTAILDKAAKGGTATVAVADGMARRVLAAAGQRADAACNP